MIQLSKSTNEHITIHSRINLTSAMIQQTHWYDGVPGFHITIMVTKNSEREKLNFLLAYDYKPHQQFRHSA